MVQHVERYLFEVGLIPALALCSDAPRPEPLPPVDASALEAWLLEPAADGRVRAERHHAPLPSGDRRVRRAAASLRCGADAGSRGARRRRGRRHDRRADRSLGPARFVRNGGFCAVLRDAGAPWNAPHAKAPGKLSVKDSRGVAPIRSVTRGREWDCARGLFRRASLGGAARGRGHSLLDFLRNPHRAAVPDAGGAPSVLGCPPRRGGFAHAPSDQTLGCEIRPRPVRSCRLFQAERSGRAAVLFRPRAPVFAPHFRPRPNTASPAQYTHATSQRHGVEYDL